MKKIVWSMMTIGAMFFATQNIQAQEEEIEMETEMEIEDVQDEFTSVEVAALPQAVQDAIITDYNDAIVSEAWVKTTDEAMVYKIKLDIKGETKKVYIDQDGNWLEDED
ncbi:hypothetical protein [Christiangramia sabulilitoris]|uniref:Uncharacterized protein n=1 Tax=Christiangramia sabulilitoris TaxID=2583991 RepID=A0A550I877_9FLAO|nr:hypothetical protein [Christiangramia sabulilitoris]TRO67174.1 hypothetical protein FGM01_04635 [Christiangramia sabulilitoris]